jgi:hypothetical protein
MAKRENESSHEDGWPKRTSFLSPRQMSRFKKEAEGDFPLNLKARRSRENWEDVFFPSSSRIAHLYGP